MKNNCNSVRQIQADKEQILVVDFGGQTAHLICRRLRDHGVYAQIISPLTPVFKWLHKCDLQNIKGLIFSGSPFSVYEENAPQPCEQILALAALVPTLGICYGLHWFSQHLGGRVEALEHKEYGPNSVHVLQPDELLTKYIAPDFISWMSHADSLKSLPPQFELLGQSEHGLPAIVRSVGLNIASSALRDAVQNGLASAGFSETQSTAIIAKDFQFYGLQFHPEVSHCEYGQQFLTNFAAVICNCATSWTLESWQKAEAKEICRQVGDSPVALLISGGVDSSVVAAMLLRHLPAEQIHLLYFDTGLMRLGETEQVAMQLSELGAKYVHQVDARAGVYPGSGWDFRT